jgi:hypothetical protein
MVTRPDVPEGKETIMPDPKPTLAVRPFCCQKRLLAGAEVLPISANVP